MAEGTPPALLINLWGFVILKAAQELRYGRRIGVGLPHSTAFSLDPRRVSWTWGLVWLVVTPEHQAPIHVQLSHTTITQ